MKLLIFCTILVGVVAFLLTTGQFNVYMKILFGYLPNSIQTLFSKYVTVPQGGKKEVILTKEELKKFDGENGSPIYLAILGKVFDVTRGRKHYGKEGGYSGFAARDGTRAFITGDFTDEGLIEDISGLKLEEILGLKDWQNFYRKDYTYVGKLVGHFFDEEGKGTDAYREYVKRLKIATKDKEERVSDFKKFPSCNSESAQGKGRKLWCSNRSGGIKRDWEGLPREYFKPGSAGPRCACVKDKGPPTGHPADTPHNNVGDMENPNMKVYKDCDPKSISCSFPE